MRKLYLLGLFFLASVGAEAGLPQKSIHFQLVM